MLPTETTTTKRGDATVTVTPHLNRFAPRLILWLLLIEQGLATACGGIVVLSATAMASLQDARLVSKGILLAIAVAERTTMPPRSRQALLNQ